MKAVLGLQGSGKSAFSIDYMLKNKKEYTKIFTNIENFANGLSYENIYYNNLYDFFDILLPELYQLHKVHKLPDSALMEKFKEFFNMQPTEEVLIVFDEAHNRFNKKDDVLLWFVTYHRHLHCEVMIITQSASLIHKDYHIINDVFVIYSPMYQFYKSKIRYAKHTLFPPSKANFLEADSIKKTDSLFNLYTSGGSVKTKPFLMKLIIQLILFFVFGVGFLYYYFVDSSPTAKTESQNVNTVPSTAKTESQNVNIVSSTVSTVPQISNTEPSIDFTNKIYAVLSLDNDFVSIDSLDIRDIPYDVFLSSASQIGYQESKKVSMGYGVTYIYGFLDPDKVQSLYLPPKPDIDPVETPDLKDITTEERS